MTVAKFITLLLIVAPIVYLILRFLTRAPMQRAIAALVGGLIGAFVGAGLDAVGHSLGLWYYVTASPSHAPWPIYVAAGFLQGGFALVGWRIRQHFGNGLQTVFMLVIA